MIAWNITNNLGQVLTKIFNLMETMLSYLNNIQIGNTSLLRIIITITLLSIVLPILLSLGKETVSVSERIHKVRDYDVPEKKDNYKGYQKDPKYKRR